MHESYSYIPLTKFEQQFNQESGLEVNSPILFELLNIFQQENYYEILDVFPASQSIVDSFSDFHCKLYLPGCGNELYAMKSDQYDTPNKLHRAFVTQFGFYKKHRSSLNVILLWDLPNYLDKQIMTALVDYLIDHVNEEVKLHFYIHTRQQMPSSPGVYSILPGAKVWLENNAESTIKSPLYFQESLQTLFQPFKVIRSMQLSSGLQEYILGL